MSKSKFGNTQSAFSLIEMLMIMALASVMAAVILPQFIDFSKDAKTAMSTRKLKELKEAIIGNAELISNGAYTKSGFENDLGAVPSALNDLILQGAYPAYDPYTKSGWRGPYVNNSDSNWKKDAWGSDIEYQPVTRTLSSCGVDTVCGNADDIVIDF